MWHHLMRGNASAIYAIVEELDLTITQMKALHALADCGCEVSVKELGDRLAMSLPGASRIGITESGRAVVKRIDNARLAGIEQYTASLSPEQRSRLAGALADLPHHS